MRFYGCDAVCAYVVSFMGDRQVRDRSAENIVLRPLALGKKLGAYSLTESGSGSDAGAMKTTAVRDGDSYVLNGSKLFVTNGGEADVYIVLP